MSRRIELSAREHCNGSLDVCAATSESLDQAVLLALAICRDTPGYWRLEPADLDASPKCAPVLCLSARPGNNHKWQQIPPGTPPDAIIRGWLMQIKPVGRTGGGDGSYSRAWRIQANPTDGIRVSPRWGYTSK